MSSFWFIIKQQWTTEEISIFSNSSHLKWRAGLSDTILKWDYPRPIPAKFGLIWFNGFREEDLNVIYKTDCQYIENYRSSNTNSTRNWGQLWCPGTVSSSCFTCDIRRITVERHEHHMIWKYEDKTMSKLKINCSSKHLKSTDETWLQYIQPLKTKSCLSQITDNPGTVLYETALNLKR